MSVIHIGAADASPFGFKSVKIVTSDVVQQTFLKADACIFLVFAHWCGHCQQFAPQFEAFAQKYGAKIPFFAVDAEQMVETQLPSEVFWTNIDEQGQKSHFGGVPRVVFYTKGKSHDTVLGNDPTKFLQILERLLKN
jgi:thiol-disulfide isomerase/thioredoxin